ncbi:peptidoglycan-binding domain-containing protein [Agromyces laixinhei]|uniref:peptidoglycan-binding domain-containing protein n=1 Tax=Agromyces laixinhei TaxID=2585717 RepID=UPI0018DE4207
MAVQRQVVQYGYGGPIDGVWGVNTWKAIQRMAQQGGYGGPIDGLPGSNTWYALWNLFRPHLREA